MPNLFDQATFGSIITNLDVILMDDIGGELGNWIGIDGNLDGTPSFSKVRTLGEILKVELVNANNDSVGREG